MTTFGAVWTVAVVVDCGADAVAEAEAVARALYNIGATWRGATCDKAADNIGGWLANAGVFPCGGVVTRADDTCGWLGGGGVVREV